MFDLHGNEKIIAWKKFREQLETSKTPFEDLAVFWGQAPFVNNYLDKTAPETWPDPWALVLDGTFDDLAISLGMLYTIKLTQRFQDADCKIFMTTDSDHKSFLVINNDSILNWHYREVCDQGALANVEFKLVWSKIDTL